MRSSQQSLASQRGFSALEMLVVVALMGVLSAFACFQMTTARPAMKGDGAMRVVISQVRMAREMAITQRRYMRVVFTSPNRVQIFREEVPGPSTTLMGTAFVEGSISFALINGLPDTPDAFGKDAPVHFGVVTNIKFSPDGTLVNQDGQSINGSVFMAMPTIARSARAVTVLGSTGRIRGYRWDGRAWRLV
jgi:prepilin-type N-terminal cleavage/methylation domain-containing protein